jgi:lysophospholipase L1-like esterase
VLICALGDSRTYGAGATVGSDPLTLLLEIFRQRHPTARFLGNNQAVNGTSLRFWAHDARLTQALASFEQSTTTMAEEREVYVQIMLGVNDASTDQHLSVEEYQHSLQILIERILAAQLIGFAGIVLHSSFYVVPGKFSPALDETTNALIRAYNAVLPALADEREVFLGDRRAYEYFEAESERLFDGVHADNAGNHALASLWADAYQALWTQP